MTVFLTVAQVIRYHDRESGAALNDRGKLEGAVGRPMSGFGGHLVHATLWTQAGALLHAIDRAQAFEDGNKRTAWFSTIAFLRANGFRIVVAQAEAAEFSKSVGRGERDVPSIAMWLFSHSEQLP
ncbi:type II toxin-antitoxin system death-on-curing family toxin [Curtobacterium sp. 22159]|uniref:type II toxin-antitoxin system death-on-curing family toxin n=1 Tax=Curtobacterium sp. 22159 TaxID=3453882 RepID=UPI003F84CD59